MFLVVLASIASLAQLGEPGKDARILARGDWPHLPVYQAGAPSVPQQGPIRNERELARVAGAHALAGLTVALKVKAIDFDKQMVIAVTGTRQPMVGVSGGGAPSAPSRVAIQRVARDATGKTLTVRWQFVPRGEEILTAPLTAILVDRFDGPVVFQRVGAGAPAGGEPAEAGTEVKVQAQASWPDGWKAEYDPQLWTVRSYAELIDPRLAAPEPVLEKMRQVALAKYLKALKVDAIDFKKMTIVGVSGGTQRAGSSVKITAIDQGDGQAIVRWKLNARPQAVGPGLSHPGEVVLVEHLNGTIRFDPPPVQPRRPGPGGRERD